MGAAPGGGQAGRCTAAAVEIVGDSARRIEIIDPARPVEIEAEAERPLIED